LIVTAQQQLFQLPDGSRAILEAAALLDQPFSVPLLIDLGFSADALDPLFDNGIFREAFPNRAEFTNSELRNELLGGMPWSKKRRFCEQVGELLSHRRDALGEAADFFCRAHRYGNARICCVQAAKEACHSGHYAKAFSLLRRAMEIWPAGEDTDKRTQTLKEMARCARHARELCAAQLAWEEILATCRATGSEEGEIEARNQIAELSQVLGDHAAALSSLREAAELRQRRGSDLQAARQWFALANYLASRIRARDAFAALAPAREAAEKARHVGLISEILAFEGFIFSMMGKHDEARARVDSSLQIALTQAVFAEAARCHGDLASAVALMREAIEGYDRLGAMLEMAFLRRRFAPMLATLGQPREAEEKRREAFELARRLGLRPFLDCLQSDTVPVASLLSEDTSRPPAAIGLTPRQRSILGLIAKGLTNKEIASHLNLSARTIEMHVALALERLNCRTRSEGVSRAFSQGLLRIKD
jgi:DNA-binding CsgD family transcriptional regulator